MAEALGVEEEFSVDMEELTDYPSLHLPLLIGYVGHIVKQADGSICLVALKTAARKPIQPQVDQSLQITGYSLGATALGFNLDELKLGLSNLRIGTQRDLVTLETT
jgi:hypothetical protein